MISVVRLVAVHRFGPIEPGGDLWKPSGSDTSRDASGACTLIMSDCIYTEPQDKYRDFDNYF